MYGLTEADLDIQARAREFADELIPFEVTAEMNGGELPPEVTAKYAARARDLGLCATNMPAELGGGERVEALADEGGDDPRQHVAGAAGRHAGVAGLVAVELLAVGN